MNLVKNQTYLWNDMLTGLNAVAGPVFYVLHYKGTENVAAACLRIDKNPRAPYELIPSNGQFIAPWADKFCAQREPVPVFVQELDGNWYYRGRFKVAGQSSDPNEIEQRKKQAHRTDVYKIIFLQEVPEGD